MSEVTQILEQIETGNIQQPRHMFGPISSTRVVDVKDGTSNTVAVCESTLDVFNGTRSPWGYRAWVHAGVDLIAGINRWDFSSLPTPKFGQLGSWGRAGSMHPGGLNILLADGSVRFLGENTNLLTLSYLSHMDDGNAFEMP